MAEAAPNPLPFIATARPRGNEDVAIEAEFRQAEAEATIDAWALFIRRHPNHILTPRAIAERDRLIRQPTRD